MADANGYLADLDTVASPRVKVHLNDQDWWLSGDPDSELIVNMMVLGQEMAKAVEAQDVERIRDLGGETHELIEDLFGEHNEIPEGGLKISDRQINELLNSLMQHYQTLAQKASGGGEGDPPTGDNGAASAETPQRKPARKRATRTRRSKSQSASSGSSPS